jgi:hypothetical protein
VNASSSIDAASLDWSERWWLSPRLRRLPFATLIISRSFSLPASMAASQLYCCTVLALVLERYSQVVGAP